jgi:hypothetical protein
MLAWLLGLLITGPLVFAGAEAGPVKQHPYPLGIYHVVRTSATRHAPPEHPCRGLPPQQCDSTTITASGSKPRVTRGRPTHRATNYVQVAHGQFAGRSWTLAIGGHRWQRCYRLWLQGRGNGGGSTCRPCRRPPDDWTRVIGDSDLNDSATVELDITRKKVRSMRLRIRHPHSHIKANWSHAKTHRMRPGEAREARVKRNFRFAVLHSRGTLCVTKVVLFGKSGARIDSFAVPCEY